MTRVRVEVLHKGLCVAVVGVGRLVVDARAPPVAYDVVRLGCDSEGGAGEFGRVVVAGRKCEELNTVISMYRGRFIGGLKRTSPTLKAAFLTST